MNLKRSNHIAFCFWAAIRVLALVPFVLGFVLCAANAQLDNLTPAQIEQLKAARAGGAQIPPGTTASPKPQEPVVLSPAPGGHGEAFGSLIEKVMSDRVGQRVTQFGYDQVGIGKSVIVPQVGALQDDYVLGPGDEVRVTLRGQENSDFGAFVDRNGQVTLPKIGPVSASGKSLGALKQDLVAAIGRAYISTQAYISLGQLRQLTVFVAGEVDNPGARILTGLSSPLDALLISGGVKKSGSLRSIQLVRQGRTYSIDLYGVLIKQGSQQLMRLHDGDRIFVPPIGATVAVSGYVRRPAIYELPAGARTVRAGDLISLASGVVLRGASTASILRIMPDGKGQFFDVSGQPGATVQDGEAVIVKSAVNISVGRVILTGAVRTPGVFSIDRFKTLRQILPTRDVLQPGAYILFGFIDRINQETLQHEALPFSPLRVLSGKEDVALNSDDTIHVLSIQDMSSIVDTPIDAEREPKQDTSESSSAPNDASVASRTTGNRSEAGGAPLAAGFNTRDQSNSSAASGTATGASSAATTSGGSVGSVASSAADAGGRTLAASSVAPADSSVAVAVVIGNTSAQYGKKLSDYRFTLSGAVQKPGSYLAAPKTSLADVLTVLGGLTSDVDLSDFELTSIVVDNASGVARTERKRLPVTPEQLAILELQPYDYIKFRRVFSDRDQGAVSIEGQVRYPGGYNILRTERLSSVLMRAGGLTDAAYPQGTVFLRQEVARGQVENARRLASDIRSQLFTVMMRPAPSGSQAPTGETIVVLQNLIGQLENQPALGRVSYIADPVYLTEHPEKDPILQPGDRIIIPKVPSSVTVMGEVMQPGAFPVDKSMSAFDYIEAAGGTTEFADTSRVIVVYPDGSAKVAGSSWLSFGGETLPPGTTVVVARDITGFTLRQIIMDTTQIISQFAVTAASLAVLSTSIK